MDVQTRIILEELAEEFNTQPRREGDVAVRDLMERLNTTYKTAKDFMKPKVEAGEYAEIQVRDDMTGKEILVYRRLDPEPEKPE